MRLPDHEIEGVFFGTQPLLVEVFESPKPVPSFMWQSSVSAGGGQAGSLSQPGQFAGLWGEGDDLEQFSHFLRCGEAMPALL